MGDPIATAINHACQRRLLMFDKKILFIGNKLADAKVEHLRRRLDDIKAKFDELPESEHKAYIKPTLKDAEQLFGREQKFVDLYINNSSKPMHCSRHICMLAQESIVSNQE
jgi:hypothetical protein